MLRKNEYAVKKDGKYFGRRYAHPASVHSTWKEGFFMFDERYRFHTKADAKKTAREVGGKPVLVVSHSSQAWKPDYEREASNNPYRRRLKSKGRSSRRKHSRRRNPRRGPPHYGNQYYQAGGTPYTALIGEKVKGYGPGGRYAPWEKWWEKKKSSRKKKR